MNTITPAAKFHGRASHITAAFWSAFLTMTVITRPATVGAELWDMWVATKNTPPYRAWEQWCRTMGIGFEVLLKHLSSYSTNPQMPFQIKQESKWRADVLRHMVMWAPPVYADLIRAYATNTIKTAIQTSPGHDLRLKRTEVNSYRTFKWVELFKSKGFGPDSRLPGELVDVVKPEQWKKWMCGQTHPPVHLAGYVGTALGSGYDTLFEFYHTGYVTDGEMTEGQRRSMNNLRHHFNKSWPTDVQAQFCSPEAVHMRQLASRLNAFERRRKILDETRKRIEERILRCESERDSQGVLYAKHELHILDKQDQTTRLPLKAMPQYRLPSTASFEYHGSPERVPSPTGHSPPPTTIAAAPPTLPPPPPPPPLGWVYDHSLR